MLRFAPALVGMLVALPALALEQAAIDKVAQQTGQVCALYAAEIRDKIPSHPTPSQGAASERLAAICADPRAYAIEAGDIRAAFAVYKLVRSLAMDLAGVQKDGP